MGSRLLEILQEVRLGTEQENPPKKYCTARNITKSTANYIISATENIINNIRNYVSKTELHKDTTENLTSKLLVLPA